MVATQNTAAAPAPVGREYLDGLQDVIHALSMAEIRSFIGHLDEAYQSSRQIFIVGNGGSAATASHMACDLGKTVLGQGLPQGIKRFRVIALTDNMPLITAWANDVTFDDVFAEQLRGLASAGDLLVVITGSGNSPNILQAVTVAKEMGLTTVGLLGFEGGAVRTLLDDALIVRSRNYGYIEDVHMILTHLVTAHFKALLAQLTASAH